MFYQIGHVCFIGSQVHAVRQLGYFAYI